MSNFRGEAPGDRGEATNFRGEAPGDHGEAPGDRGEATGDRGEATNFHGEATNFNTHFGDASPKSGKKMLQSFGCIRFFSYLCSHHCVSITVT